MNVLGSMPAPSTSIDACVWDGFHLNSGVKIDGGKGALLVSGEAFGWSPWSSDKRVFNQKGQFEIGDDAWGVLDLVWPKPDLLIIGMGKEVRPLSMETRRYLGGLGIRVEVADTRNASAQFNLLATERGTGNVAAALIPIGWKDEVGCV
ncbi:NADH dehydrogenase 1 alpha subcomplex assembly factor 3 [Bisporella sp. PMI_857]|nr:NADH dehydrogenase 1 alpha subcomplex assembly factor 3 [Bisporella sp. PMI_857]